jgi:Apg6 BARA domain
MSWLSAQHACCRCGRGPYEAQEQCSTDHSRHLTQRSGQQWLAHDESFVVLPHSQPMISDSYFGNPTSTNVAHESMSGSLVHVSHQGLGEHVRQANLLRMFAAGEAEAVRSANAAAAPDRKHSTSGSSSKSNKCSALCRGCHESAMQLLHNEARRTRADIAAHRAFQLSLQDLSQSDSSSSGCTAAAATAADNAAVSARAAADAEDLQEVQRLKEALAVTRAERATLAAELHSLAEREAVLAAEATAVWEGVRALESAADARQELAAQGVARCNSIAQATAALRSRRVLSDLFTVTVPVLAPTSSSSSSSKGLSRLTSSTNSSSTSSSSIHAYCKLNGLRLARAADDSAGLHWEESCAAWGEAVLLLYCVSSAVHFTSAAWRLVPLTATARVLALGPQQRITAVHVLTYTGDSSSSSSSSGSSSSSSSSSSSAQSKLDAAISAFVACATELAACVAQHAASSSSSSTNAKARSSSIGSTAAAVVPACPLNTIVLPKAGQSESKSSKQQWQQCIHQLSAGLKWLVDVAAEHACVA